MNIMLDQRFSDNDQSKRDIPSFIEPMPPLISNPFMRPRPQKGTNLLELFEDDSELDEPELVQVYLRLKPHQFATNNLYEVKSDRCLITSVDTATAGHGRRTQHNVSKMYTFSHIFGPDASQKEIFEKVVKDNLKKLPDGHSFTLLTYGASGSGKTYTLMGTVASPGLVPRSLEYVFRVVDAAQQPLFRPSDGGAEKLNYAEQEYELKWVKRLRHVSAPLRDKYRRMSAGLSNDFTVSSMDLSNRTRHYVWVSFVEIYNEGIYDLLAVSDRSSASKLRIREDSNGHVYVKGASQAFVRSGSEAYDVMAAGKHQLQVAATGVHAHSSRSHCIFTITMLTETDAGVRTSCVRLCDLAGCERARHTRNTGARMAESRAINSSLHVLERCLHTLRRRQRNRATGTCVPYRESKLTRLLGAGLSGARGESVAMVVTLNPAPEYAHETKHVLQLAAVARDIQVNSTISETILESSSQDTTVNVSADLLRLRSENERIHFELLQAQARNRELMAAMEEKQQEAAITMRELVEEAKDMTRQYYEVQIQSLKAEMDEMVEEYESRLSKAAAATTNNGTPSSTRSLQKKVAQLMTEIAILEEKLTAERLARACAEEEMQHLRACIEERDEKAFEDQISNNHEDVMSLSDNDVDSEEEIHDPCNESLEPTFKKEGINRSRLFTSCVDNKSYHYDSTVPDFHENTEHTTDIFEYNGALNSSNLTLLNHGKSVKSMEQNMKDSVYDYGENYRNPNNDNFNSSTREIERVKTAVTTTAEVYLESATEVNSKLAENLHNTTDNKIEIPKSICLEEKHEVTQNCNNLEKGNNAIPKSIARGTYFVSDININSAPESLEKKADLYQKSPTKLEKYNVDMITNISEKLVNKIMTSAKSTHARETSLAQFEQLEKAANYCNDTKVACNDFGNVKILKEKRTYFDDKSTNVVKDEILISPKSNKEKKVYFDNIDVNIETTANKKEKDITGDVNKQLDDTRSPSIVKDEILIDYKPSTLKILLGDNLTRQKPDSIDIFEELDSPHCNVKTNESHNIVENTRQLINQLVLEQKSASKVNTKNYIKSEQPIIHEDPLQKSNSISLPTDRIVSQQQAKETVHLEKANAKVASQDERKTETNQDNTIEEFENIYKDITAPRATEFDLLVSQETSNITIDEKGFKSAVEATKYNLRHKSHTKELRFTDKVETGEVEEVLLESSAKCENKTKLTKRSLRLRKRKNQTESEDKSDLENDNKLKDIVNLQKEFSDVCLDVPAPVKEIKDIESPKKPDGEQENVPPLMGIQSCPSKSVTRSRRKLFTPRTEPLEEGEAPGDSNERLYVPRPSYHRARARRKL